MFEFDFSDDLRKRFEFILQYVKDWCSNHQWEIGIAEMAAGAAILKWGVTTGAIEIGTHLVATEGAKKVSIFGGAVGSGIGLLSMSMVGSIGVAGMGSAIGVPAIVVIGGGALLLGACGYTASDLIYSFTNTPVDVTSSLSGTPLVMLGTALMLDGARRFLGDEKVQNLAACFRDSVLKLPKLKTKIVADTLDDLKRIIDEIASLPEDKVDALGNAASVATGAAAGAAIGSSMAAGSVTVLGSHVLGGLAASLGLISPPLWPVIAVGAAGAGTFHILWKISKKWGEGPSGEVA